jgi:uncharacterized protein (TIGR03086 family)
MPDLALERRAFAGAARQLAVVVARIGDEQWSLAVPDELRWRDSIRTLRDLVAHHACDDAWVPDVLAGRTLDQVGGSHDGDLLGDEPAASVVVLTEAAVSAVTRAYDPTRVVHLSYGAFPASEYLLHATIFRGLGAYDIAQLIGDDGALPDVLIDDLLALILPQLDALRAMGVFGSAIAVPTSARPLARLLALTGRASAGLTLGARRTDGLGDLP